jgi:hypothetical protein
VIELSRLSLGYAQIESKKGAEKGSWAWKILYNDYNEINRDRKDITHDDRAECFRT